MAIVPTVMGAVQGVKGFFGGAQQQPVYYPPQYTTPSAPGYVAPPLDVQAEQARAAEAGTIPGTPIGPGQAAYARPDLSAQISALQQQIAGMQQGAPSAAGPPNVPNINQTPSAPQTSYIGEERFNLPPQLTGQQQAAPAEQGPPQAASAWEAGRVVGQRTTGGVEYVTIATGVGQETITRPAAPGEVVWRTW